MEGGTTETYNWTGNLDYLQSEEVILPSFFFNGTDNVFNVRISNPNGGIDEQKENDFLSSSFELVPDYPNEFKVVIDANNFGNENSWIISDMDGTALYWKFGLTSNQYNIDTINLPNGCYLFELTDNGDDGLDFWWSNATTGTGSAKLQQVFPPYILKTFNPDFGSDVYKSLFDFVDFGTANIIQEQIKTAVNNFEPRVDNVRVEVDPSPDTNEAEYDKSSLSTSDASISNVYEPSSCICTSGIKDKTGESLTDDTSTIKLVWLTYSVSVTSTSIIKEPKKS